MTYVLVMYLQHFKGYYEFTRLLGSTMNLKPFQTPKFINSPFYIILQFINLPRTFQKLLGVHPLPRLHDEFETIPN